MNGTVGPTPWSDFGGRAAAAYQGRFDDKPAAGEDAHGEATFVASIAEPPARVLDAGCGVGRVSAELTRRGFRVVGVDKDPGVLAIARERDHESRYELADLATLFLRGQTFDVVLMAGNVIPLLAPHTLYGVMKRVAAHVNGGGVAVAGFGVDEAHLPVGCPVTPLSEYEKACEVAGLAPVARYSTWAKDAFRRSDGYVVEVHRLR